MPSLLEMKNITMQFGEVKAVDNVSLKLEAGQVLSLCGENGSGKSTLMKVLCGIYPHGSYQGDIYFSDDLLAAKNIRDTEQKGIAIIHQELALVKQMTVLENMFLGNEWRRYGVMDYDAMYLRCQTHAGAGQAGGRSQYPMWANWGWGSNSWWKSPRR